MHVLVNSSVADIRVDADQRSELHSQSLLGDILQVIEQKQNWYYCQLFDGSYGWVHCGYLVNNETSLVKYTQGDMLVVTSIGACIFTEPHGNSEVIRPLSVATRVAATTYKNSWHQVVTPDGTTGWIYSHFVTPTVSLDDYQPKLIVEKSRRLMGIPYLWGGTSSFAIDCSGFTQLLHRIFNITLPRNASQQIETGEFVCDTLQFEKIKAGDLLFFSEGKVIDHVGLFMGDGQMIHATLGKGQVRVDKLDCDGDDYQKKLISMFKEARRVSAN
jgi:SH3-like domain-containing protein